MGGDAVLWRDALDRAGTDGPGALARAWSALRYDHPRFQRCQAWSIDAGGDQHREVVAGFLHYLRGHAPIPPTEESHGLAALEATDLWLAEVRSGVGATAVRCAVPAPAGDVWVRPRPAGSSPRAATQPNHLQAYLTRHWVCPASVAGIAVRFAEPPHWVVRDLESMARASGPTVYAGGFADGVAPRWEEADGLLTTAGLTDDAVREAVAAQHLAAASAGAADILLLPELTLPAPLRDRLAGRLEGRAGTPALVLPGTYHERVGGALLNRALLYDRCGQVVLMQDKIQPAGHLGSAGGSRRVEGIATGDSVTALLTPAGALGIAICLDFCQEGDPMRGLWQDLGAELLLVPSMSDGATLRAHARRAESLRRMHGTGTVIAIQPAGTEDALAHATWYPGRGKGSTHACNPDHHGETPACGATRGVW